MAKVYVGTYRKYTNGSIKGAWLDLTDYATYQDFVAACRKLHKDEEDPELMIQDTSDFPDGLDCGEWMSEQDFADVKTAMQKEQQDSDAALDLSIVDYSDKAFAVIGDTRSVKEQLKKLGGRFNGKLTCGAGWIFPVKMREAVEKFVANGSVTTSERTPSTAEDKALLDEYLSEMRKVWGKDGRMIDYCRKKYSSAVRLSNGGILVFEKDRIDNEFCFADEGPEYEFYKSLSDDKRLAKYFKEENLAAIDNRIARLEGRIKDAQVLTIYPECYNSYPQPLNVYDWRWLREWDLQERDPCIINTNEEKMSDDDRKIILAGLKVERAKFEKRLDTYLKRYGVSKIRTWSYWRDA